MIWAGDGQLQPWEQFLKVNHYFRQEYHRKICDNNILDENIIGKYSKRENILKDDQFRDQYIEQFDFPYCEEVSKYEKQAKIGQVHCDRKLERENC